MASSLNLVCCPHPCRRPCHCYFLNFRSSGKRRCWACSLGSQGHFLCRLYGGRAFARALTLKMNSLLGPQEGAATTIPTTTTATKISSPPNSFRQSLHFFLLLSPTRVAAVALPKLTKGPDTWARSTSEASQLEQPEVTTTRFSRGLRKHLRASQLLGLEFLLLLLLQHVSCARWFWKEEYTLEGGSSQLRCHGEQRYLSLQPSPPTHPRANVCVLIFYHDPCCSNLRHLFTLEFV